MFSGFRSRVREAVENIANRASSAALDTFQRTTALLRDLAEDIKEVFGGASDAEEAQIEEVEERASNAVFEQTARAIQDITDAEEEAQRLLDDVATDEDADIDFNESTADEEIELWVTYGFPYWDAKRLVDSGILLYETTILTGTRRRALPFYTDVLEYIDDIPAGYVEGVLFEAGFFYVYVA